MAVCFVIAANNEVIAIGHRLHRPARRPRSAFSLQCLLRTACPVSDLPAQHRPCSQITAIAPHRAPPLPTTPRSVTSFARAVSRTCPRGGVCIPLASTFQRQLTAHVKTTGHWHFSAGHWLVCGVSAGHWRFSAPSHPASPPLLAPF